ncbi:hypothetical protein HOH87_07935 [bacterium]|jgi:hypothetical protein|nr:hypothetical protein [bacterium]
MAQAITGLNSKGTASAAQATEAIAQNPLSTIAKENVANIEQQLNQPGVTVSFNQQTNTLTASKDGGVIGQTNVKDTQVTNTTDVITELAKGLTDAIANTAKAQSAEATTNAAKSSSSAAASETASLSDQLATLAPQKATTVDVAPNGQA